MNDQQKRMILEQLNKFVQNNEGQRMREVLSKFSQNMKISSIQTRFYKKLLDTKYGQALSLFQKWKNLPDTAVPEAVINANKFQNRLHSLVTRNLKSGFAPLYNIHSEAQALKKRSIVHLINKTKSKSTRMFERWKSLCNVLQHIKLTKQTIDFFETLNSVVASNAKPLLESDNTNRKIERVLKACNRNISARTDEMFARWKSATHLLRIHAFVTQEKRRLCISGIESALSSSQGARIRQTLARFKKHASIQSITQRFLLRLLNTSHAKAVTLFHKWRNLPELRDDNLTKTASRFERRLVEFANKRNRLGFQPLRDSQLSAEARMKRCVVALANKYISTEQRMFNRWLKAAQNQKRDAMCMKMVGVFDICRAALKQTTDKFILPAASRQTRQQHAISLLVKNNLSKMTQGLTVWRHVNLEHTNRSKLARVQALYQAIAATIQQNVRPVYQSSANEADG